MGLKSNVSLAVFHARHFARMVSAESVVKSGTGGAFPGMVVSTPQLELPAALFLSVHNVQFNPAWSYRFKP